MDCEKEFSEEQLTAARELLRRRQEAAAARKAVQLAEDAEEEAYHNREVSRMRLWRLLGTHADDDCKLAWKSRIMQMVEEEDNAHSSTRSSWTE